MCVEGGGGGCRLGANMACYLLRIDLTNLLDSAFVIGS